MRPGIAPLIFLIALSGCAVMGAASETRLRLLAVDAEGFANVRTQNIGDDLLLYGNVSSEPHREAAETIARSASGHPGAVFNEIQTTPCAASADTDEAIAAQIRDRYAEAGGGLRRVNPIVSCGAVFLTGRAQSEENVRRSAEIASVAPGVRRVVSFIRVEQQQARVRRAAAQPHQNNAVERTLRERLTAADPEGFSDIDVAVVGADLLLYGSVASAQHKQLAEQYARAATEDGAITTVYDEITTNPCGDGHAQGDAFIADFIQRAFARRLTQQEQILSEVPNAEAGLQLQGVEIRVSCGNVYLLGSAPTAQDGRRAAEIASTAPHVSRVVSLLRVNGQLATQNTY